jgi:hypothetical protein
METAVTPAFLTEVPQSIQRERVFFLLMAVAAMATVFLGFAPTFYLRSLTHATHYPTGIPVRASLPLLLRVHALVFSSWILLLVAQTTLVTVGRTSIHRRLGIAAALLIPAMVILGYLTAVQGGRDGWNPGGPYADSLAFMVVGIGDIVVFASFAILGLYYRKRPDIHKRLMILATVGGLMWPAITRMPYVAIRPPLMFGLLFLLVMAPAIRDRLVLGRIHTLSLGGGAIILLLFPLRVAVGHTAAWHHLCEWLIG